MAPERSDTARFRTGAFCAGLLGSASAVFFAFVYVAVNDWFGASDIGAFAFWCAPFAVLLAVVALTARTWLQQTSRSRRYVISAFLGLCYGLVWTMAVALGMGPWVGAFSFPILYLWMLGGLSAMLVWAFFVGRVKASADQHTLLSRASTIKRIGGLVILLPIGAVLLALGINFGFMAGSVHIWDRAEPELHLIPEGFEGPVLIVFNDSAGAPLSREGKSRLYMIPPSGVLYTQFSPNDGWSRPVYMYVDEQGNRAPIVTGAPCEDLPEDPVQACLMGRQFVSHGRHAGADYKAYVVGRKANRRELYSRGDSLVSKIIFDAP